MWEEIVAIRNPNKNRPPRKGTTPLNISQRSTCNVLIYRWKNPNIARVQNVNITSKNQLPINEAVGQLGVDAFNLDKKLSDPVWIRNDIIRCNITKSKGASSGTFSLTLKRGKVVRDNKVTSQDIDYLKVLNPGDWILIYMKKSGKVNPLKHAGAVDLSPQSGLKFVGIIENVRYIEIDDPGSAFPRLEYVITGRDFGKVFDMSIYFNPLLAKETIDSALGARFLTTPEKIFGVDEQTPDNIIKRIVDFYIGNSLNINNQSWYIPPSMSSVFGGVKKEKSKAKSVIDILNTNRIGLHKYSNNKFIGVRPLMGAVLVSSIPSSGTVWSIMNNFQNPLVNEMYTELEEVKGELRPSLILRQCPFSNKKGATNIFSTKFDSFSPEEATKVLSKYQVPAKPDSAKDKTEKHEKTYLVDLPRVEIESADIKQKNIGKSEFERINHIVIAPRILDNSFSPLFVSAINSVSLQRHGLKTFQGQTQYVFLKKISDKNIPNNTELYTTVEVETFYKSEQKAQGAFEVLHKILSLLQDWFFLGHNFYNGTIIIDGRDSFVGLGQNLYIKDIKQLFHIEGYSHTFELFSNGRIQYNTELRVSRGQILDGERSYFIDGSKDKPSVSIVTSVLEARPERDR